MAIVLRRRELILGLGALVAGARPAAGQDAVEFVGVDEVRKLQQSPRRPLLIDVRSADEFRDAHIAGAVNIPLGEIERRQGEVPREGLVVLY
jgi:3-mercaptopyruvate sulfurtransferase SseA